jgi:DNA-binding NtrC family response regulator
LDVADIRLDLSPARPAAATAGTGFIPEGMNLEQFEDGIIQEAVRRAGGNKSQAARLLGMSRNALRYRLTKIGVPDEEDSAVGGGTLAARLLRQRRA